MHGRRHRLTALSALSAQFSRATPRGAAVAAAAQPLLHHTGHSQLENRHA
jgi:hypothetical protein